MARPQPEPLDPPMVPFAVAGIAAWAVAGLVLLPFHGWLSRHNHTNWLWTCVAGVLLGFVGLALMIRRDARRRPPAA
jgi:drug/metabolite transporter (DMT)-like permease